jgi:hypothetical protein
MTTKLGLYNGALRLCKERKLATITENRQPRHLLDDAWADGQTEGAVKRCLELGQWTFATRTQEIYASSSVEPDFGYRNAFDQPTDMVDIIALCSDQYLENPLTRYIDERHYWYADIDPIYVSYVSNDPSYGADLSLWPQSFADMVEAELARQICGSLTGADNAYVEKIYKDRLIIAKSGDAMRKPTRFMPEGSWSAARRGGWGNRRGYVGTTQ